MDPRWRDCTYPHADRQEVMVLENMWRDRIERACHVTAALGLGHALPRDLVRAIVQQRTDLRLRAMDCRPRGGGRPGEYTLEMHHHHPYANWR